MKKSLFLAVAAVAAVVTISWPPTPRTQAAANSSSTQPTAPDPSRTAAPDQLKADLDYLFKTIEEAHVEPYAYTKRSEFLAERQRLYEQINRPLNGIEFYKLVAPVVARLENGHTAVYPFPAAYSAFAKNGGRIFPLEIDWSGKTATVRGNHGSAPVPKGSVLLTINGEDVGQLFARICRRFPSERKDCNWTVINRRELLPMFLWAEFGPVNSLALRVRDLAGKEQTCDLGFVSAEEIERKAGPRQPWSFRTIEDGRVGLLELTGFDDPKQLKPFLKQTFNGLRRDGITDLIIDIRENPGGTDLASQLLLGYLLDKPIPLYAQCKVKISAPLRQAQPWWDSELAKLPPDQRPKDGQVITLEAGKWGTWIKPNGERFAGRVFVLISPRSASTSMGFAALVRASGCGTLVGQETGDPVSLYGDSLGFNTPNANLPFVVASKYFLQVKDVPADRGALPHHEVAPNPKDTALGIDTVLEYTIKLTRESRSSSR